MKLDERKSTFIFLGLLILVSLAVFVWGIHILYVAFVSNSWPTTEGKIISSSIMSEYSRGPRRDRGNLIYCPKLAYKYSVEDKTYTSEIISALGNVCSKDKNYAIDTTYRYSQADKITVHYNPDNAQESFLETGLTWTKFVPSIISGMIILAGIFALKRESKQL